MEHSFVVGLLHFSMANSGTVVMQHGFSKKVVSITWQVGVTW